MSIETGLCGIIQSKPPMRSPLLSSHLHLNVTFSCHIIENLMGIEPLLRCHLSYKATFFSKCVLIIRV